MRERSEEEKKINFKDLYCYCCKGVCVCVCPRAHVDACLCVWISFFSSASPTVLKRCGICPGVNQFSAQSCHLTWGSDCKIDTKDAWYSPRPPTAIISIFGSSLDIYSPYFPGLFLCPLPLFLSLNSEALTLWGLPTGWTDNKPVKKGLAEE